MSPGFNRLLMACATLSCEDALASINSCLSWCHRSEGTANPHRHSLTPFLTCSTVGSVCTIQFSMVISRGFSASSDKPIWLYSPASTGVVGFAVGGGNKADCSLSALLPISGVSLYYTSRKQEQSHPLSTN